MLTTLAALSAAGAAGTVARWGVVSAAGAWGTLAVNLSGCFLAGLIDAYLSRRGWAGQRERMTLLVGFCGAYTTFSTLILELNALMSQSPGRAALYAFVSLAAGFALLRLGSAAGGL